MTNWPTLVKTALLGTDRATETLTPNSDTIGKLLTQLPEQTATQRLLAMAATHTLHRDIGRLPHKEAVPLLPAAPRDDLPRTHVRLRRYFKGTINGRYTSALPELLLNVANNNQRVPAEVVPNLLRYGRGQTHLHPLIRQTIGQRGQWLAAQNPSWSYAIGGATNIGDPNTIWQTGSSAERRHLLQHLRATNPQQALSLVQSTWDEEAPRDRNEFIRTFSVGLSMADEPFFEALLDDRSYPVRRQAVGFLSGLTESRLCQRMTTRMGSLVVLKRGRNGRFLDIPAPPELNPTVVRDGIIGKAANRGLNAESWRTAQIIGAVPLTVWTEKFGMTPQELVKAAVSGHKASTLVHGWSLATRRQKDAAWSEALLFGAKIGVGTNQMLDLVTNLTIPQQETLALQLLNDQPSLKTLNQEHPVTVTLKKMKHIWGKELAQAIMHRLADDISDDKKGSLLDWRFREAVKRFAYHFPTSLFDEAQTILAPAANGRIWQIRIKEFIDILQFRRDMLRAVNQ